MKNAVIDLMTMTKRSGKLALKSVDGLVTAAVLPVVVLLVMVVLFGGAIDESGHYIDYVVSGVLLSSVGQVAAGSALRMATNKDKGIIKRFKTMPFFSESLLFGEMVVSILQSFLSAVVLIGVAMLLGLKAHFTVISVLWLILFITIFAAGISLIGMGLGLGATPEAAASFPMLFIFLPYLSSGFVAVDTMPNFLHGFARNMPFTPIIESFRSTIMAGNHHYFSMAMIWSFLFLIVGVGSALRSFKKVN